MFQYVKYLLRLLLLGALILSASLFPHPAFAATEEQTIRDGIYAQDISLGGMTREEAIEAIDTYFHGIADSEFTIVCLDGARETVTVSDWELTWDAETTVDQALKLGNEGTLISRYKSQMNLKYGNIYLDVAYSVSPDAVMATLANLASEHDSPAVNAKLTHSGNSFTVSDTEQTGTVTDTDATLDIIIDVLADDLSASMSAQVVGRTDEPSVRAEDLAGISDELGTFTTSYANSTANRKTNIAVATEFLDGTVLMPGESLSVSTAIRPRTEENGYTEAAQYSNGESEQAIGGGVCQVSTTIYNALLRAELQIDERHNHSMVVSYVDYGTDASIAEGAKDLVFTNNLDDPIYIEGIADGNFLTFSIYGVETRPSDRTVEYVAETTSITWPTEKKTAYSSDLASGTSQITGTVRPEVYATLTKVVTVDGVETERTLMHTDHYWPSQQTITYGTG